MQLKFGLLIYRISTINRGGQFIFIAHQIEKNDRFEAKVIYTTYNLCLRYEWSRLKLFLFLRSYIRLF